jgi:thiol-disulfide isomerase/thioredoxin
MQMATFRSFSLVCPNSDIVSTAFVDICNSRSVKKNSKWVSSAVTEEEFNAILSDAGDKLVSVCSRMVTSRCIFFLGKKFLGVNSMLGYDSYEVYFALQVVVDISTTTCGPCKMIFPKLVEMSLAYPDAVFLKINGNTNADSRVGLG